MSEKEIKEFVAKSIEQIKSGLPEGCGLNGNFDFEVSVIVTKGTKGGINISLVDAGANYTLQQIHKIRFSIADKKSQKENLDEAMNTLRRFFNELKELDKKKVKRKNG
jgi:hypothetical protein